MSDLQIPAEAEAVAHAFGVSPRILADTAPFIVAAAFRQLHREAARSDMETFDQLLRALWDRADELDGGEPS